MRSHQIEVSYRKNGLHMAAYVPVSSLATVASSEADVFVSLPLLLPSIVVEKGSMRHRTTTSLVLRWLQQAKPGFSPLPHVPPLSGRFSIVGDRLSCALPLCSSLNQTAQDKERR